MVAFKSQLSAQCSSSRLRVAKQAPRFRADTLFYIPLNRWKVTGEARLGCFALPVPTRQANRPYFSDISFSANFVFAHSGRARNNRTSAFVTVISADVKVMSSHMCL
jgi:hypothetical protein